MYILLLSRNILITNSSISSYISELWVNVICNSKSLEIVNSDLNYKLFNEFKEEAPQNIVSSILTKSLCDLSESYWILF